MKGYSSWRFYFYLEYTDPEKVFGNQRVLVGFRCMFAELQYPLKFVFLLKYVKVKHR